MTDLKALLSNAEALLGTLESKLKEVQRGRDRAEERATVLGLRAETAEEATQRAEAKVKELREVSSETFQSLVRAGPDIGDLATKGFPYAVDALAAKAINLERQVEEWSDRSGAAERQLAEARAEAHQYKQDHDAELAGAAALRVYGARDDETFPDFVRRLAAALTEALAEVERRTDCHAGPGTTEPACVVCGHPASHHAGCGAESDSECLIQDGVLACTCKHYVFATPDQPAAPTTNGAEGVRGAHRSQDAERYPAPGHNPPATALESVGASVSSPPPKPELDGYESLLDALRKLHADPEVIDAAERVAQRRRAPSVPVPPPPQARAQCSGCAGTGRASLAWANEPDVPCSRCSSSVPPPPPPPPWITLNDLAQAVRDAHTVDGDCGCGEVGSCIYNALRNVVELLQRRAAHKSEEAEG